MTKEELKEKVLEYKWEVWIGRPFGAFFSSLGQGGNSREYMRRCGVDAEIPASLFQKGEWYQSEDVWNEFDKQLTIFLDKGGNIYDVVRHCENRLGEGGERIKRQEKEVFDAKKIFAGLYDILTLIWSHFWLAHGFEHLFAKELRSEISKYINGDVEKNIGDISFPSKKNAHNFFIEALRSDQPLESIQKRYGWIKTRGGFAPGFTLDELAEERKRFKSGEDVEKIFEKPKIPKELENLAKIAQELVYYRTLRTDVLFELMWIARPLMTKIAGFLGLSFDELRDYSAVDLLRGKLEKFEYGNFSALSYGGQLELFHGSVLRETKFKFEDVLKGSIAYKGFAKGKVKVVMVAHEIGKVEEGDILVAPTTAPSFIFGMKKAIAFVTDEGGITSHAAIVSREMRKPCIIGTKIATKVLKDGDLVEVDAEKGVVKILKKANR